MLKTTFGSRRDSQQSYSPVRLGLPWPLSIPNPIPHRIRRKLRSKIRSRQSPSSNTFTQLHTSYNPRDTLRSLAEHKWSVYDGQYLVLLVLGIFSLCIIPSPGPLIKTAISTIIITALILPVSRQFLLPSLAIWMWLIFFYACGSVSISLRPLPPLRYPHGGYAGLCRVKQARSIHVHKADLLEL